MREIRVRGAELGEALEMREIRVPRAEVGEEVVAIKVQKAVVVGEVREPKVPKAAVVVGVARWHHFFNSSWFSEFMWVQVTLMVLGLVLGWQQK